jgi:ABC-type branched-subunit amino acid transport system ATPase component
VSGAVLECRGVSKHYGGIAALDDIQLCFEAGTITAIIGPNGAGKTTLLNVISGFDCPDSGEVVYRGRNITGLAPESIARLRISRTFQRSRVITELTVTENILLAASTEKEESIAAALFGITTPKRCKDLQRRVATAIEFAGLAGYDDRLAGELSYGQQKLLALACCVASGAETMLLDEPLAGIAPDIVERVLQMLHDLAARGCTVVLIEHDLTSVKLVAGRVAALHHGKAIGFGTPAEVLESPLLLEAFLE